MNEVTEIGAENNALARRYGGQTPLVFTMASDAFPIIPMGFADMDPELLAIRGDAMRAGCDGLHGPVAARFCAVGLANPVSSGVIAIVEGIRCRSGAASNIELRTQGLAVSALGGSVLGFPLDSRQTERASVRVLQTDEAAVANYGNRLMSFDNSGTADRAVDYPIVLAPSSTLWVLAATVNISIYAAFRWRQRRIVSQEAAS